MKLLIKLRVSDRRVEREGVTILANEYTYLADNKDCAFSFFEINGH